MPAIVALIVWIGWLCMWFEYALMGGLAGAALGLLAGFWLRGLVDADRIADLIYQLDQCESGHIVQIDRIQEEAHHRAYRAFGDTRPGAGRPGRPDT